MKKIMMLLVPLAVSGLVHAAVYNKGYYSKDTINVRPTPILEAGPVEFNKPLMNLQIPKNVDRITHKNLLELKNKVHMLIDQFNNLSDADKKQIAEQVKDKIMNLKEKIHALPQVQKDQIADFILQLKHAVMHKVHTFLKLHKETLTPAEEHQIAQAVRTFGPIKMKLIKTIMKLKHPGLTHAKSGVITGDYGHEEDAMDEMNLIHE